MEYYLGLDIGTTSAKAVAFSAAGHVIASHACPYKMYHPQPNWSEQDPEEVFQATLLSCNSVVSSMKAPPLLVSFSAAMHGLIVMDNENKPITNCIIWADNRSAEIAERLKRSDWGSYLYHNTGVPLHAMSPLCKLIWLKENQSPIFRKAYKFISIKEYVCYKLFNRYLIDTSIASGSGLLNINSLSWDEKILELLELKPSSLSHVVPPKHTIFLQQNPFVQRYVLLPRNTPFVIGGSDGPLANLGTGAVHDHSMAITIGTSGAARMMVPKPQTDPHMRTFCYHLKDGLYVTGGAGNNGAIVLNWLKENLLEAKEDLSELFDRAATVEPGSNNLIFVPYILGERAPVWNSNARGIYFGLHINHTKSHLIRACMEGVIYSLYSIAKILFKTRIVTEIYATGGFVQSPLWVQMLADVCNKRVLISSAAESSARGAVIIGMEAMNLPSFPDQKILSTFQPDLLNHEKYSRNFQKFERLYQAVKDDLMSEE